MSSAFDDVKIEWKGRQYTIPSRNMMRAIALIEDHVTMPELQRYGERNTAPVSRLSSAFASVLRFAGAPGVRDEDVYDAMFSGGDDAAAVATSVQVLLAMMVPKSARDRMHEAASKGDPEPGNSLPAVAETSNSSEKLTSSRSVKGGSRRRSSGKSRQKNSTG
jgi:hypothetical protein